MRNIVGPSIKESVLLISIKKTIAIKLGWTIVEVTHVIGLGSARVTSFGNAMKIDELSQFYCVLQISLAGADAD